MLTPEEKTALEAFHQAALEVARVFDDCSPWGGPAAGIAREVGRTLENETGEFTVEIPAGYRALFREGIGLETSFISDEPSEDVDCSPEAEAFRAYLTGVDQATPTGALTIKVDSITGQRLLTHVLTECANAQIREIDPEKTCDADRRREFDEKVEEIEVWFRLLEQIEPSA